MAYIELYQEKLQHNYNFLEKIFRKHNKDWAVVTKLLCGNKMYIKEVINLGAKELCDSRISNLKVVKSIDPSIETAYIKPPAKRSISSIVKYADASFNTEFETIRVLSLEAQRQKKMHKVIIMIELGDLREGVMGETLMDFYKSVFMLPNIKVTGIGTNLNCLNGVLPSQDKLVQLSLYKQLIETKFERKIPWVTGGTSVILPLLFHRQVPEGVNHFRIGETLYFGNNLITNEPMKGMKQDVIKLFAEIIEITEKPKVPIGYMAENVAGDTYEINEDDYGKTSYRAILDIGLLDINADHILPDDKRLKFVGASSDMVVMDLGNTRRDYKVGDLIAFKLRYMGALSLLSSSYIEKRLV